MTCNVSQPTACQVFAIAGKRGELSRAEEGHGSRKAKLEVDGTNLVDAFSFYK